jgi:AhpD family alkylhydroperoxidase
MHPRLNPFKLEPTLMQSLVELDQNIVSAGLEVPLIELVKIRASQMNSCAYCLHMHTQDALSHGEDPKRIFLLEAFEESALFTEREKAALRWTEIVTAVDETHAPDAEYQKIKSILTDLEIVRLTLVIGMINTWNRLCTAFRSVHPNDSSRS